MSKEEIEKAKDVLNNFKLLFLKNIKENTDTYICNHYTKVFRDNIETLLQYIDQLEQYLEKISKQLDNVAIDQIPIGIAELQQENNKQNKIIDEMAKWIFNKDYTENSLLIHRDDYYSNCIKQVKQYFEKKVEEDNE